MSDKNIEIIKHIQAIGRCPEDDMIATSSFTESGFQPKVGNKFDIKKSVTTSPPAIPTKGSSAIPGKTSRQDVKFELDLDKFIERTDDLFIGHLQNEIEWFKSRMDAYRESFFKICDIVEHSDCADILKKLVREERNRY